LFLFCCPLLRLGGHLPTEVKKTKLFFSSFVFFVKRQNPGPLQGITPLSLSDGLIQGRLVSPPHILFSKERASTLAFRFFKFPFLESPPFEFPPFLRLCFRTVTSVFSSTLLLLRFSTQVAPPVRLFFPSFGFSPTSPPHPPSFWPPEVSAKLPPPPFLCFWTPCSQFPCTFLRPFQSSQRDYFFPSGGRFFVGFIVVPFALLSLTTASGFFPFFPLQFFLCPHPRLFEA